MKPLIVLLITFGISVLILHFLNGFLEMRQWRTAGCVAMAVMLFFTAIAHFKFVKGMEMIVPQFLPFKKSIVILTGILEIAAGISLLFPAWQVTIGWWLILFFIVIMPANISAALRYINLEKGTLNGSGPAYLWFRVPLQIFFILWVYLFAIKL